MPINRRWPAFWDKRFRAAALTIGGIAALFPFFFNMFGASGIAHKFWLDFLLLSTIGCIAGALYLSIISYLLRRFSTEQDRSLLFRVSLLHFPLWLFFLHPLDLQFAVFFLKFAFPFNDSFYFILALFFTIVITRFFLNDNKFRYVALTTKYTFFLLLSLTILQSFRLTIFAEFLSQVLSFFSVYVVAFLGLASLFLNVDQIARVEEAERKKADSIRLKKSSFKSDYPRLARVPILNRVIVYLRGQGRLVSVILIAVIFLGSFNTLFRLGYQDFKNDEFYFAATAKGFLETGEFQRWVWHQSDEWNHKKKLRKYSRSWPHTALIAASFAMFGETEWSARLPSALCGILFFILLYVLCLKMWDDRWCSLFILSIGVFTKPAILFFRLTRMYAPLLLLTFVLFYLLFKWLTEPNRIVFGTRRANRIIERHFNFDFRTLIAFCVIFGFTLIIHINVGVLLPFLLLFSIWLLLSERDPRYLLLVIFGLLVSVAAVLVSQFTSILAAFSNQIVPFSRNNIVYFKYFATFPAGFAFNFIITFFGLGLIFISPSKKRRRLLAALFITAAVCAAFFVWFANRYPAQKYAFHIIMLFIIFKVGVFYILTTMYPKVLRWILVLGLVAHSAVLFSESFSSIYGDAYRYGRFSKVCEKVKKSYTKNQIVVSYYPSLYSYYYRGASGRIPFHSIRGKRKPWQIGDKWLRGKRGFYEFLNLLYRYKEGWVAWPNYKTRKILPEVRQYFEKHFEDKTALGTRSKLYYYTRKMMAGMKNNVKDVVGNTTRTGMLSEGRGGVGFRGAFKTGLSIDLKNPFSISMWIFVPKKTRTSPLYLGDYRKGGISIELSRKKRKQGIRFRYKKSGKGSVVKSGRIEKEWHHIGFYQEGGSKGKKYGLYVDGKIADKTSIRRAKNKTIQLQVKNFGGLIQDLRIYDIALKPEQMAEIYNEGKGTSETVLKTEKSQFSPVQHWKPIEIELP